MRRGKVSWPALGCWIVTLWLPGCAPGHMMDVIKGSTEGDRVPAAQRFIDQPYGAVQPAGTSGTGKSANKGLLGPELYDIDGTVRAARITAYMHQIVDRELQNYPGARPVRGIYIDASPEPSAFSTPGGDIWVTLGLLSNLETESELAAVLAHEAGHIQLNHFASTDYFEAQRKTLTAGAGAALVAVSASYSNFDVGRAGLRVTQTDRQAAATDSFYVVAGTWLVNQISDGVVATAWQRGQEEQADLVAADILAASGYDADGMTSVLAMLGAKLEQRAQLGKAIAERKEAMADKLAQTNPLIAIQRLPEFVIVNSKDFAGGVAEDVWVELGANHPRPQDRQRWVAPYIASRYSDQQYGPDEIVSDQDKLASAMAAGLPARIKDGHYAANEARQHLAEGDLPAAKKAIDTALRSAASNSAHVRTVAYLVAKASGDEKAAFRHLTSVTADDVKPRRYYQFLAGEYLTRKQWGQAERALEDGIKQFGNEEPFLPSLITVAVAQKDEPAARAVHERCRQAESDAIKTACDNEIAPLGLEDLQPAMSEGLLVWFGKVVPDFGALGRKFWKGMGT